MFIFAYGAMLAYMVVLGDTIPSIAVQSGFELLQNRALSIVIFAVLFILPLCLLRDMSSLAWTSFISIVADIVLVCIVLYRAPEQAELNGISVQIEDAPFAFLRPTMFAGFGTMSFA